MFEKAGKVHRVKLYHHPNSSLKGDCLVTFLKEEAAQAAVQLFNGHEIRTGCIIAVAPADFGAKNAVTNQYNAGMW